jgi:hypothetical protein
MVGGLGLTAFALVLMTIASNLAVNLCYVEGSYAGPYLCTEQDKQNREVKTLISQIVAPPMRLLGIIISIFAFITWINVRRW